MSLLLSLLVLFVVGCGEEFKKTKPFVDTIIDGDNEIDVPTNIKRDHDCLILVQYVNSVENGMLGVLSGEEDLDSFQNGIQFKVGVVLLESQLKDESPRVKVNDEIYFTIKSDDVYWANVSLKRPIDTIILSAFSTKKECDRDYHVLTIDYDW